MTKQAIRMALAACVVAGVSGCAAMATGSASATASASPAAPPHLAEMDGMTKLIVDGPHFICVAGELMNSTSSDFKAIQSILPRLAQAHLNTVLSVVSWDLI